ncbi:hypothetical protein [cf. Phormidesmis sp. LEGE 11477]|uniref:hypothetical protein n=1 Tax=cf. Phormidesmis sp. LEGE 11477 TaxID=1828680 RepID=UPI00188180BE|nr:hypothetical protein [cf. Phormidesmis sp. LEGE 11477]MBE9061805.1 hypothetical protein [cf. Phormidesmis sp. LEGE 11477]
MMIKINEYKTHLALATATALLTTGFAVRGSLTFQPGSELMSIEKADITEVSLEHLSSSLSSSYDRIQVGMALVEVQALLVHPGTEISSSQNTATYRWMDAAHSTQITGTFEQGHLIEKSRGKL